jgi:long-subunit fatty acid transport protein
MILIPMGKKCLKIALSGVFVLSISLSALGQGAGDVLRFGLQYPSQDAVGVVMPGVTNATGFGAYQENPASMALFDESFFSFSLSNRYVNEEGTYLGNTSSFDDNNASVGDIGFVYNVPTARGKLTVGGGYSQTHDFNRAFSGSARNNLSTLTDKYAALSLNDPLNTAAFNAFAIDDVQGEDRSLSILRFPVGSDYAGINQNFETTEQGTLGEYSAFLATEVLKNFIVGASIGVISGTYTYERDFLEIDSENDYDGEFIDSDGDGTFDSDINTIRSEDTINQTFTGFSARLGVIYQPTSFINIGAGYQFKNTITVDEEFDTFITTTLDNGDFFEGDDLGEIRYDIIRPSRFNAGLTLNNLSGLTFSASTERVDYSEGRIEFDELEFEQVENDENRIVESNLEDVYNYRFGLEYQVNEQFTPRIGYGYYPSPTGDFENQELDGDRRFYSAGFTAQISENTKLNLGGQLGIWDDRNTVYSTPDVSESITENVNHWNIFAGLTFQF